MTDTQTLLADYVTSGSEAAFRELVTRYIDLVYSTSVRLVGGDTHLAEDVAQTVFVDLARKARTFPPDVMLGGWLHRDTCFVASKVMRGERRRQFRERHAMEINSRQDHSEANLAQVAPILDEAINQLSNEDRSAIMLRFFEQRNLRSVGEALGSTENAAQKRITRALEELRLLLKHRGISLSATALGTALTGKAVSAAPAGLAVSISSSALITAAAGTGTTLTFLKFMALSKLQLGVVSTILLASLMTPLLIQYQTNARLHEQEEALRQHAAQLSQLEAENQRLASLLAQKSSRALANNQSLEIPKLRSEIGRLTRNVREITSPQATNNAQSPDEKVSSLQKQYSQQLDLLKQWLETNPSEKIPELQYLKDDDWINTLGGRLETDEDFARTMRIVRSNAELQLFNRLRTALRKYTQENNGQFPTDLSQLKPYFKSPVDDVILQRYQILPANSLVKELRPDEDWVITQKAPVNPSLDIRMVMSLTETRVADERVTNRWSLVR